MSRRGDLTRFQRERLKNAREQLLPLLEPPVMNGLVKTEDVQDVEQMIKDIERLLGY